MPKQSNKKSNYFIHNKVLINSDDFCVKKEDRSGTLEMNEMIFNLVKYNVHCPNIAGRKKQHHA